jgi:hypothetical protein
MVTRYIGNGRTRESGLMATHRQDFEAHVTGGDWKHNAADIVVIGLSQSNVQTALAANQVSISNSVIGPSSSVSGTIPIFSGSSGKLLSNSDISINGFGDLLFKNNQFHYITLSVVDNPVAATSYPSLVIEGQDNITGHGGNVKIVGGYNSVSAKYDGYVELYSDSSINISSIGGNIDLAGGGNVNLAGNTISLTSSGFGNTVNLTGFNVILTATAVVVKSPELSFDAVQATPKITQTFVSFGPGQSLTIASQDSNNDVGGDLILSAGGSLGLGYASGGNLYLSGGTGNAGVGNIFFSSPTVEFDQYQASPKITQQAHAAAGASLTVSAQNSSGATGGSLNLAGGTGTPSGNVNLVAEAVVLTSALLTIDVAQVTPKITQTFVPSGPAQPLTIAAQDSSNNNGGDLVLKGGSTVGLGSGLGGNLILAAGQGTSTKGNIFFGSPTVEFDQNQISPVILQQAIAGATGQPLLIKAQTSDGVGGNLILQSGFGAAGNDGYVNIEGGGGGINLSGLLVAVSNPLFLRDTTQPNTPDVAGIYLYSVGGLLYIKGGDGIQRQINTTP